MHRRGQIGGRPDVEGVRRQQVEDIPGVGRAALYAPGADQLNVFLDDSPMIMVSVRRVADNALGKDVVAALAKKVKARVFNQ